MLSVNARQEADTIFKGERLKTLKSLQEKQSLPLL